MVGESFNKIHRSQPKERMRCGAEHHQTQLRWGWVQLVWLVRQTVANTDIIRNTILVGQKLIFVLIYLWRILWSPEWIPGWKGLGAPECPALSRAKSVFFFEVADVDCARINVIYSKYISFSLTFSIKEIFWVVSVEWMLCFVVEKRWYVMVWVNVPCWYSDIHHHSVQQPFPQHF